MKPSAADAWFWFAVRGTAAAVAVFVSCGIAWACDTPVYRYATYNWTPSPYRIYHISRGQPLAADDAIRRVVAELTTSPPDAPRAVANLELVEIDAAAENPLDPLPAALRDEAGFVLERATTSDDGQALPELPRFAVVLPNGYPVYEGPLSGDDVRAIADSPARRKLVELLAGGKAAVMVLVEGDKAEDNAAAALIDATIARAGKGELSPPPDPALSTTAPDAKPAQVDVGAIRLRRDDPAEKWFAMSLLHVEPDIDERTEPMVFSVYARGRVNPPAIGTGISAEELDRQVRFVLGPCACTVKHDNPGMDLALVADWDAIALAMAKRFGSETGNERLLGEVPGLFPEIVDVEAPAAKPGLPPEEQPSPPREVSTAASAANTAVPTTSSESSRVSADPPLQRASGPNPAANDFQTGMSLDEATREEPSDAMLLRKIGIGVAAAIVLLGAASVALFRRPA